MIGHTMQVCFVNTEQKPLKIKRLGLFKCDKRENKLFVYELCEIFYPHPDAPEDATISLLNFMECVVPIGFGDTIEFTCKGMQGLKSVLKLEYYNELVAK